MAKSREESGSWLWKCVFFSGLLHVGLIWSLWIMPHLPYRKTPVYPVYTVELVGGEEVGGTTLGTEVVPREPREETKRAKVETPPKVQKVEKQTANKEPAKKEAVKKEERKPVEKGTSMQEPDKPERAKKEVKESPPAAEGLPESLREKLIQAALQKVRDRAAGEKKAETGKKEEKEPLSAGPGEGVGAAALGPGGRGGGIVKAFEFLIYRNQMLRFIRDRWTWVGKRADLEVTVRFGIQENGQIVGLKVIRRSGDPSYDESVIRAVTKASPLPPPPENYRKEFMNVELTFLPKDLGG
jgi:TonB family protein